MNSKVSITGSCEHEDKLRQDIEEAIERTVDDFNDATQWWSKPWFKAETGEPPINDLINRIVFSAKEYKNRVDNAENVY